LRAYAAACAQEWESSVRMRVCANSSLAALELRRVRRRGETHTNKLTLVVGACVTCARRWSRVCAAGERSGADSAPLRLVLIVVNVVALVHIVVNFVVLFSC